jgi:stage II sporulation protein AA (anti-sigma F factor antagonist)
MFSVRVTRNDTATVIVLTGDVDYDKRDAINAAMTDALTALPAELVVDLQAVTFIDSVGVEAAIASPARVAGTLGTAFHVEPSVGVRRILRQMGLDDLLERGRAADAEAE